MIPKLLDIVYWPDDRLHQPCDTITKFDGDFLERLSADMILTMLHNSGYGLAAPQVGHNIQMLVMLTDAMDDDPLVLINPEIIEQSDSPFEWREGCLSVPGYFETRKRPNRTVVRFNDVEGEIHQTEFIGIWSFVVQHEMDHLHGKVFVDDLSPFKTKRVQEKIKKTLKRMR